MDRKIIVRLIGGLGNQLFQIQYALKLQDEIGGYVEFDDSSFIRAKQPHEKIGITSLELPFLIKKLSWRDLYVRRIFEKLFFKMNLKAPRFIAASFHFEGQKKRVSANNKVIIEGFWQNTSYIFEPFLHYLREKLLIDKHKCESSNKKICVHIRRGDYLKNKQRGVNHFDVVAINYYQNGFKFYIDKYINPKFHIFTDDEDWALNIFSSRSDVTVITTKNIQPINVLAQMALYEKFIIANSSLSWWAAVLSTKKNKEVICPAKWTVTTSSENYRLPSWIIGSDK